MNCTRQRKTIQSNPKGRILLMHSMGNEVFKSFMENYDGQLSPGLFDVIILAAPEVDLKGHAQWIEKINFANNVYVMLNREDKGINT